MVKAYLRYEPAIAFGVIVSVDSNIAYDSSGKLLLAAALDAVALWNPRQGLSKILRPSHLPSPPSIAVSSLCASPSSPSLIASGHADGSIRLWDCEKGTCEATFNGHKSAVTALRFNRLGSTLASGSKDCDVILWDVVGESGLFRLRGHRDQVTDLIFLDSGKKLVTCSKDKFMRVWDLETQHCVQIVSGHHSEIWSLDVDPQERYLVTGSADPELRIYHVSHEANETESQSKWDVLKHFGDVQRQSKDRAATVRFNKLGSLLGCQAAGKTIEIYHVLDDAEAKRKAKRRIHRKKVKASANAASEANGSSSINDPLSSQEPQHPAIIVSDVFKLLQILRASKKLSSFAFSPSVPPKGGLATLSLSLNNNTLETYVVEDNKITKTHAIELQGHRSDIRSVSLSSDNMLLMSTSYSTVKIWNPSTGSCIRTIESGDGLCSTFVPTNRHALVGAAKGALHIIDVGSGSCIEKVEAHSQDVLSIVNTPDGGGFVTGSYDGDLKFWEYRLLQDSKQLTVANVRTFNMNEEVLAISISPDGEKIAVALMTCKIKVYFMDSMKFLLDLHGHKLPVLAMDISSDGQLLVTGSMDKDMKIWGLDFGDCHKSIFAHADSVMAVQFVRNTHYVFSVGKDRLVKYWDADKFELLLTLEGHHAEVQCLAVSNRGDFIVTGSRDRSIRRWDRTEEPFFIEEEREKRLEKMFESDLDFSSENRYAPREEFSEEGSVGVAGKKTQETLTATDMIIDALDLAEEEIKRITKHKEDAKDGSVVHFQPNVLMRGLSPSDYVLHSLSSVHSNDLDQTLLSLPFSDALKLISYLTGWAFNPEKVELLSRIATVLLLTHYSQLSSTPAARPTLMVLRNILQEKVKECKDNIGFNLAAMGHLKELLSMKSDAPFRNAKAKLLDLRLQQSKRHHRTEFEDKKRKRKQKDLSQMLAGA